MSKKHSPKLIKTIINQYANGQPVTHLCVEHNIPRSTIYSWIKRHQKLKSEAKTDISYQDYYNLKRRADKMQEQLEVIKAAGCGFSAPLKEKLEALEGLQNQYSVRTLCDALEVSRGTFYNHIFRRQKVAKHEIHRENIREQVRVVFDEYKQRFGSKKIAAILGERGIRTSSKYVAELMREMGLQSIGKHLKRDRQNEIIRTRRQNRLRQQFKVSEPNRVWVSDTTCFKVKERYYYICVIIDLFSRKIVAHRISPKHSTYLITSAVRRALKDRDYPQQLTFHSDQGSQYTSKAFRNLLYVNKVVQSFSRTGSPHDNAVVEAFFASLKKEELYRINFKSEREFYQCVDRYMVLYNTERPHETLIIRHQRNLKPYIKIRKSRSAN